MTVAVNGRAAFGGAAVKGGLVPSLPDGRLITCGSCGFAWGAAAGAPLVTWGSSPGRFMMVGRSPAAAGATATAITARTTRMRDMGVLPDGRGSTLRAPVLDHRAPAHTRGKHSAKP